MTSRCPSTDSSARPEDVLMMGGSALTHSNRDSSLADIQGLNIASVVASGDVPLFAESSTWLDLELVHAVVTAAAAYLSSLIRRW